MNKIIEKLQDAFDFVFNDTVLTVGEWVVNLFTVTASAYYAFTGSFPIIPQWAWLGIFGFTIITGTFATENLIHLGYDEEGNKILDDEEGDDEIVPD